MSVRTDTPPLEISEIDGPKRKLVLSGRALPLKDGGILFGVKQRSTTTFYAGNPVGRRQVFGPTLPPTSINGKWSDRWIGSQTADGDTVQPEAVAELDGQQLASLADLDALLESMAGTGIELEVKWGHKLRRGTLDSYEGTWRTIHDLEWKMEFQWSSRGEPKEPARIPTSTPQSQVAQWSATKERLTELADASGLSLVDEYLLDIQGDVYGLTVAIDDYVNQANQFVAQVLSPGETVLALTSALDSIVESAKKLLDRLTTQVDRALVQAPQSIDGISDAVAGAGDDLAAAAWARDLKDQAQGTRDDAAQERSDLVRQVDERLRDIYLAVEGDDLRSVSSQEYGTPDHWRDLLAFNALTTSALQPGQVVLIPEIGSGL